jgi:ankyrin repeat protein
MHKKRRIENNYKTLADIDDYLLVVIIDRENHLTIEYFHKTYESLLLWDPLRFIRANSNFYLLRLSEIISPILRLTLSQLKSFTDLKIIGDDFSRIEDKFHICHTDTPRFMINILMNGYSFHNYSRSIYNCKLQISSLLPDGSTYIHQAVIYNSSQIIPILIDIGVDINVTNKDGKTALCLATELGNQIVTRTLLMFNPDIMIPDLDCWLPIHFAIRENLPYDIIEKLCFDHKKHLFEKNSITPILLAVIHSNYNVVKLLLDRGADINSKDIFNRTPIIESINNKNSQIFKLLLAHNPDLNIITYEGFNVLYYSIMHNKWYEDIIATKKVDLNSKLANNYTVSHIAAIQNNIDCIKLLVEHGADFDAESIHNLTPYDCAILSGASDVVSFLARVYVSFKLNFDINKLEKYKIYFNDRIEEIINRLMSVKKLVLDKNDITITSSSSPTKSKIILKRSLLADVSPHYYDKNELLTMNI